MRWGLRGGLLCGRGTLHGHWSASPSEPHDGKPPPKRGAFLVSGLLRTTRLGVASTRTTSLLHRFGGAYL